MSAHKDRKPIRVLLVDDHQMMRDGLKLLLCQESDLKVVGEAGDGSTAIRLVTDLRPDVVVMDVGLPDVDGVELSRQVLVHQSDVRVVILTGSVNRAHLDRALAAGVNGYILKLDTASHLITAIRRAMRNEACISPDMADALVGRYKELLADGRRGDSIHLSDGEIEVLKLLADGKSTKEVAFELGLKLKTAESRRKRLMTKLGFRSIAELTKYAIRKGLTLP